jgi:HK97 family phage major capsid protein
LTKAEAELLDAAIDQLEPPTCCACCQPGCLCCGWECQGEACCAITNAQPAETPEMNSAPEIGAERAHSEEPATATPLVPTHPQAPKEKHVSALNAEERASRMPELISAIRDVAESYTGALPADVEVTYQTNKQELADLERDEAAYQQRKVDVKHIAETGTTGTGPGAEFSWGANPPNVIKRPENIYDMAEIEKRGRSPEERGQMYRDNAMRAVEATSWANPKTDIPTTENKIARLLDHADGPDKEFARRILATGDPVYVRAFNKLVKSHGNTAVLTPEEQRGTAITIGGTGQYLVPFAFDPTVIAIGAHNINPYRANCRVVEVVGASIWHALTSTAAVAVRGVENLVAAEQGPTFAQPSFTPSTVKAQITYSAEAVQDRPDLGSDLAVLLGEAKDNEEENTYSIGTGATTMLGVVGMAPATGTSGAFTALTTITGGGATVAIADLYALEMAVPMRWRPDAGWFMARQTIRKFQGFETTSGILFNATQTMGANYPAVGNPNLTPTGETGLKLLGYPVYEAPSIPVATGANAAICTLAARHQFVMVDRIGMEVQFIPWIQTAGTIYVAGQQALFAIWRNGGGPMQADAGRVLRYLT